MRVRWNDGAVLTEVDIPMLSSGQRIVVEHGRAVGVELASGEIARAGAVVSNAGVRNTFGRLLDPGDSERHGLADHVDAVGDSYALVGLNLGLRASAAELGITPANLWTHPTGDYDANLARHRKIGRAHV